MNYIVNKKISNLIDYIIIIMCIVCSGAIIYQNNNRIILIISTLSIILLYFIKYKNINLILKKNNINKIIISFLILYLFSSFIHFFINESSFFGELGKIIQLIMTIFICYIIKPENFLKKYNSILYCLAFLSIIFYLIPFVFPDFPKLFPVISDYAGSKFHNAFVYCYPTYIGKFYRNQSIFWESGAFQAFLNISIFLELFIIKNKKSKKHLLIFIIALLLTKSTTGFIIFIILILSKLIEFRTFDKKIKKALILSFPIAIAIVAVFIFPVIFDKFSQSSLSYVSFVRRMNDMFIDIKILFLKPANFLFGVGEYQYIIKFTELLNQTGIGVYSLASSSNSITALAAQYGIISAIPIYLLYTNCICSMKKLHIAFALFVLILLCLLSENFIMAPFFICFIIQLINMNKVQKKEEALKSE